MSFAVGAMLFAVHRESMRSIAYQRATINDRTPSTARSLSTPGSAREAMLRRCRGRFRVVFLRHVCLVAAQLGLKGKGLVSRIVVGDIIGIDRCGGCRRHSRGFGGLGRLIPERQFHTT